MSNPKQQTFSPYYSASKPFSSSMSNPFQSSIPNPYDSPIPNPYDEPIQNPYDVAAAPSASQTQKPKLTKFNVSGTTTSFPTDLITSKAPYSKLADIAAGYLSTADSEEEQGIWIDANADAFKVLLEYLRYDTLYIPATVPKAMVKRVFRDMGVDWPGGSGLGQISTTPPPAPEEEYTPELLAALKEIQKDLISADKVTPQARVQPQATSSTGAPTPVRRLDLPSYEESMHINPSVISNISDIKRSTSPPPAAETTSSFHSAVTSSLDAQITDLLLSRITPQLEAQAKMGILRGSVVVVPQSKPSTSSSFHSSAYVTAQEKEEDEEIISSATSVLANNGSGWCKVLRLPRVIGAEGPSTDLHSNITMAFISQPEAIKEIRRRLIKALNTGPGGVYDDTDELLNDLYDYKESEKTAPGAAEYPPPVPVEMPENISNVVASSIPPKPASSRWWKRGNASSKSSAKPQSPPPQQQILPPPPPPKKPKPKKGSVLVNVGLEDIHVRRMSDLGLYETITLKGVVVRIEVVT